MPKFKVVTAERWGVRCTYEPIEAPTKEAAIHKVTMRDGVSCESHEVIWEDHQDVDEILYVYDENDEPVFSAFPVTMLDCAKARGAQSEGGAFSMGDVEATGLPFFGGCETCGATIACYNAYPSKSGNLRCRGCLADQGFCSVAEFEAWCKTQDGEPTTSPEPSIDEQMNRAYDKFLDADDVRQLGYLHRRDLAERAADYGGPLPGIDEVSG